MTSPERHVHLSLWFDDVRIGELTLGPPDERGRRTGILAPSNEYGNARPRLQHVTLGLAALDGPTSHEIRTHLSAAIEALSAQGLMLRDADNRSIETRFLMVADYYPPTTNPALFDDRLPIAVIAELAQEPPS